MKDETLLRVGVKMEALFEVVQRRWGGREQKVGQPEYGGEQRR